MRPKYVVVFKKKNGSEHENTVKDKKGLVLNVFFFKVCIKF